MNGNTRIYEGMFLLDAANANFESACEPIRTIFARSEAEILSIKPWDEKRLAYEIGGHKRGLYVLTYFKADPARIVEIEHDCQLNEHILRTLIVHRLRVPDEEIHAQTPAMVGAKRAAERAVASQEEAEPAKTDEVPVSDKEKPAGNSDQPNETTETKTQESPQQEPQDAEEAPGEPSADKEPNP